MTRQRTPLSSALLRREGQIAGGFQAPGGAPRARLWSRRVLWGSWARCVCGCRPLGAEGPPSLPLALPERQAAGQLPETSSRSPRHHRPCLFPVTRPAAVCQRPPPEPPPSSTMSFLWGREGLFDGNNGVVTRTPEPCVRSQNTGLCGVLTLKHGWDVFRGHHALRAGQGP